MSATAPEAKAQVGKKQHKIIKQIAIFIDLPISSPLRL
jgi:hypothetical protein